MLNRRRRSSRSLAGSGLADVVAVEQDLARGGLDQAGHAAHERGLAAAREAHDDEDLAGPDVEEHVAQADRGSGLGPQLVPGRSASGVPMTLCSAGPKTFHRPRTEIVALSMGAAASARRARANGPGAGNVDVMPRPSRRGARRRRGMARCGPSVSHEAGPSC